MQFSPKFKEAVLELYWYSKIGTLGLPTKFKHLPELLETGDPNVSTAIERVARQSMDIELSLPATQIIAAIEGKAYIEPGVFNRPDLPDVLSEELDAAKNKQMVLRHFHRCEKAETLLAEFDAMLDVEEAKEALRGQLGPSCRSFVRHKQEPVK